MVKAYSSIRIYALSLLTIMLSVATLCYAEDKHSESPEHKQKIAIIDAGSSGSRLYVYEITDDQKDIKELFSYPTETKSSESNAEQESPKPKTPIMSEISLTMDGIKNYINEMTQKYEKKDETKSNENIYLYILATAGMRQQTNEKKDGFTKEFNSFIDEKHVINGFELKYADIISGCQEAAYAWINTYEEKDKSTSPTPPGNQEISPIAIIEIGGASIQIAYQVTEEEANVDKNCIKHCKYKHLHCESIPRGLNEEYKKTHDYDTEEIRSYTSPLDDFNEMIHSIKKCNPEAKNFDVSWTAGAAFDILINQKQPKDYKYLEDKKLGNELNKEQ